MFAELKKRILSHWALVNESRNLTLDSYKKEKKRKTITFLFIHERHTDREAETWQREKQAPRGEPNVGLDPGALSHSGVPRKIIYFLGLSCAPVNNHL